MKNIKVPVMPGDIFEFKANNTTVRGEISFVTLSKDKIYVSVYDGDVYTKRCAKCTCKTPQKNCEFYCENDCLLSKYTPDGMEEIDIKEIGTKYKIVRKHWGDKQEA